MKKLLAIFLLFQSLLVFADYKADYLSLLKEKKYNDLKILLEQWINEAPENPEVYIAFFNYYLNKGKISSIALASKPKGDKQIVITDPETGKVVGYLNDNNKYNKNDLAKAFEYITKGISLSPNRLDMHFGEIHLLGQIENYQEQCEQMIKVLELSKNNSNDWLWSNNQSIHSGKQFMLNNMQDYISSWIQIRTTSSLKALKLFSENEVKLYPEEVIGYNNYAYYFILTNDRKNALKWFLEAEKVNENDSIVLLNIARFYSQDNKIEKAKSYLEKVISIGDPEYSEFAKTQLENF